MNENNRKDTADNDKHKRKNIRIILSALLVLVLLSVAGSVIYFVLANNAKAQVNDFEKAVKSKDYNELSEILSDKELKVSKSEAKQFADYINKPKNKRKFIQEVKHIKTNIKANKKVKFGYITDENNRKLVEVGMNGKKYLFIDKLAFKPILHNVYIKNDSYSDTKLKYKSGEDKTKITTIKENEITSIGRFFVGKYDIEAYKIYDSDNSLIKGKVKGNIRFDTDNLSNDKKVIAHASFKDANFKVNLINSEKVDDDIKLYINDKPIEYEKNKVYGAYPVNEPLKVYAKGHINDKNFKTNTVNLKSDQGAGPQSVNLKFNEDNINGYLKNIKDIELGAKSFMEDYTKDLNKAYKESNYKFIDKYIESNSDLSRYMRSMVESKKKNKYRRPEFENVNYQDGKVNIVLEKENQNKAHIKSEYVLRYDKANEKFIIQDYRDKRVSND
ncbi:TcaA NTF2-like domain-containing protein [Staphylococcus simulans]